MRVCFFSISLSTMFIIVFVTRENPMQKKILKISLEISYFLVLIPWFQVLH